MTPPAADEALASLATQNSYASDELYYHSLKNFNYVINLRRRREKLFNFFLEVNIKI